MSYTVWDIETSIRTSFKRKANPFDPENFVVMSGYQRKGGKPIGDYFGRRGQQGGAGLPEDWFIKLLDGASLLVGFNIKFDLLYALREPRNLEAWMKWVAEGGNVWDCQLAEYLLDGMIPASHMLSMDEVAPRYGGNVKFDEVKALWASGISTEDINPDLLNRYLLGENGEKGDIGNTEVIFLGQVTRARACGQLKSILLNMGSLLCTTEMERNGMAVDVQRGMEQAAVLAERIAELSVTLAGHLPKDLPFDFNWNSSAQKSALIFGGAIKYKARVPVTDEKGQQVYAQKDVTAYVAQDGQPVYDWVAAENEATEPGWMMRNLTIFKGGKNAGEFKTKRTKVNDHEKPKSRLEDFYYQFPRITDPKPQWKGSVEGVYSTAAEVIAELSLRNIPFLKDLGKIVSLTKDLGTYYITTDPDSGESKGMLTLVQATGIIHHMLNHTSTVTGRFSSSNPNLQNLPKGGKSDVKGLFISRFKDGVIIQSDFSSLEVYVQAILTLCKQLIADLQAGLDMHCVRVSQKEKVTYEEAVARCKVEDHPLFKEWSAKRNKAKIFSFQRAYGAGVSLIALQTGMSEEEVQALVDAENERYPEIEVFYDGLTKSIKESSVPTGQVANHPDVPGMLCYFRRGNDRTPDGKLYVWTQHPAPDFIAKRPASKGGAATSFSPTEIKNYPVQGTGGEWAKAAMWLSVRAFYAERNFDGEGLLVNQVHDALYSDAAKRVAVQAAALLHACMEEASTFMEWYFDWPIPVPVPSDTTWGKSMLDETGFPKEHRPLIDTYKASVRTRYIAGYTPSFEPKQELAA